jgi:hypothetical protein
MRLVRLPRLQSIRLGEVTGSRFRAFGKSSGFDEKETAAWETPPS